MKMFEVAVQEYDGHLHMKWEDGTTISAEVSEGTVLIRADKEGLVSLARLMLTLVDEGVPVGSHWHLDSSNAFEERSCDIIIERA